MKLDQRIALKRIIATQFVAGLLGFTLITMFGHLLYGVSFVCGTVIMVINGLWLAARLEKGCSMNVQEGQRSLYAGAAMRFVSLLAGLLFAYAFGLHLLFVAVGMFVAQVLVFVLALLGFRQELVRD